MNLRPVTPAELSAVWGFVLPGLQEVIAKTGEKWTPTHVEQGINEGWAHLFVNDEMFMVFQVLKEDWTSARYLHVWVMWAKPLSARRCRDEAFAWLDEMAEKAGVGKRNWKFGSPLKGWERVDEFEIERVHYRRKRT